MCGICGKVYVDQQRQVTEQELLAMSDTMVHRGPDGDGVWSDGHVGLAHRRLAIIDLRAVAAQPMRNEDSTLWITFNGEIYNFQELRRDLEARGYQFRTASDTEVILHAYAAYGRQCLERLRGMFAFAIWDARQRVLFLARDRVGKKPLFYYHGRDRFVFASEIKALLADPTIPIEPNAVALDHFLALQYIPAPYTAFRGIYKLPAAHWLELHDGQINTGRYWQLHYTPKRSISMPDAIAELRWHFAEAVRFRLISDVPLGAFLSGGIDSSAVVSAMAQATTQPVKTFAVGFEEAAFDERAFARTVAEQYHTHHTELVVKAPVTDILPRLVWHYDEPFGDASAIPSYAIAALTRQHVTVVLNGDGGDENFAGYDRYLMQALTCRGDRLPRFLWQRLAGLLQRLPNAWQQWPGLRQGTKLATFMAVPPERRYLRWFGQLSSAERRALYTDAFASSVTASDPEALFVEAFANSDATDVVEQALSTDVTLYLADDLLTKMDRATMAHSLEARSPFLDHVLMEFVASLPADWKLAGRNKKHLLKTALRGVLPDTILDRPKMGFSAPVDQWFRHELRDMAHDILLAPRARQRGYMRTDTVTRLLHEHDTAQYNHADTLWNLLVFELWHRTFIDHDGLQPPRQNVAAAGA